MRRVLGTVGVVVAMLTSFGAADWSGASSPRTSASLEFDDPSGLAVAGGHLWVTNEAGNSVTEIDPSSGAWLTTFSRSSGYDFNRPTAITHDGADLFIANAGGSVLEMSASTGQLVRLVSSVRGDLSDPVAITTSHNMVLVLNAGRSGSLTELNARNGTLVRTIKGAPFAFDDPVAMTVAGPDVFVADKNNNSVTEVTVAGGRRVRVVAGEGLDAPDGIAVQAGNIWVSDSASNAATEINATTGAAIVTETDNDGAYGFGSPLMAIGTGGYVYIASPFGTSPMVTKVSATTGQPSWYMCNTNGPYYFSDLSAFALDGTNLWVASRTGANSMTPGASTGSLTELSTGGGNLIKTLPLPSTSSTTTSTTTTTTTTP
jgi:hypothetical protein